MQNGLGLAVAFVASVAVSVGLTRALDALRAPPARSEASGATVLPPPVPVPLEVGPTRPMTAELSSARPLTMRTPPPVAAAAPDEPAPGPERATADLERVRFETEQSFENDAPPDARSQGVERDMQRILDRATVEGSKLESVSCKRTTCRAVIRSKDALTNRNTLERVADEREGPFAQYGFIVPGRDEDATGAIRSSVFVTLR